MKVKGFCGGGKITASKYSPKDTQANRCLQIIKNKHEKNPTYNEGSSKDQQLEKHFLEKHFY